MPKKNFATKNWYDVWLPNLAPSAETIKLGNTVKTQKEWLAFEKKYRLEMAKPEKNHIPQLLADLSHQTNFSVGCYCEDESRCHRSALRDLLTEKGAKVG